MDIQVGTGETHFRVVTDGDGFRVGSATGAPHPSAVEVLWLGDSFTFGHGVDYEESFVGLIAGRSAEGVRHRNGGVAGYGMKQYREILDHRIERIGTPSRVIVVTYVGNDFHDCIWDKDLPVADGVLGNPGGLKSFLKRNLHLYRLAAATWHRVAGGEASPYAEVLEDLARPSAWEEGFLAEASSAYRAAAEGIRDRCRAHGVPLWFVILPTREAIERQRDDRTSSPEGTDPRLPVQKACEILDALDVAYLDTLAALSSHATEATFFRLDGHLTPKGCEIVADAMAARFPELLAP
jgi:hypothetical protein